MSTLQIESITVHDATGHPYQIDCCVDVEGIKRLCKDNAALRAAVLFIPKMEWSQNAGMTSDERAKANAIIRAALAGTKEGSK